MFNFSGRGIACDEAANSNPQAKRGEQVTAVRVVHTQNICGIEDDIEQQQRAEKPEERVGKHCAPQNVVTANAAQFDEKLTCEVPVEAPRQVGSGKARNSHRDQQADDGKSEEEG